MFTEYDVVLARKKLSENVPARCKGAVLLCFENNDYEVEFVDVDGGSVEVLTVAGRDLQLLNKQK